MDDIVTRLRYAVARCDHDWNLGNEWCPAPTECRLCVREREAADEIERLRLENAWYKAVNIQMNQDLTELSNR